MEPGVGLDVGLDVGVELGAELGPWAGVGEATGGGDGDREFDDGADGGLADPPQAVKPEVRRTAATAVMRRMLAIIPRGTS